MSEMVHVDVSLTLGSLQIGVAVSMFLVGILCLQSFNYFYEFGAEDSWIVSSTVGIVCAADLLHSVVLAHTVFWYTITLYGKPHELSQSVWSLNASIVLSGLIAFIVQAFFCVRVLRLTKSRLLAFVCFALALARFAFSFMVAVNTIISNSITDVETKYKWQVCVALAIGTVSDIAIAASICGVLLRNRTGLKSTDALVDRIVAFVIGSGLLTSVVAVLEIVTFLTRHDFVWLAFYTILAKLFSNSLVASLNERSKLRRDVAKPRVNNLNSRAPATQNASVIIYKTTAVELDGRPSDVMDVDYSPTREKSYNYRSESP